MQPGIWSCKNFHRYRTRDLYPLRETVFEGVPALVPYSFDRILTEEYSARALTKTMHEGYVLPSHPDISTYLDETKLTTYSSQTPLDPRAKRMGQARSTVEQTPGHQNRTTCPRPAQPAARRESEIRVGESVEVT